MALLHSKESNRKTSFPPRQVNNLSKARTNRLVKPLSKWLVQEWGLPSLAPNFVADPRAYRPLQEAPRFSRKADIPSCASSASAFIDITSFAYA